MDTKSFGNKYIIRLDRGDEIVSCLKDFCLKKGITLGSVQGIGAVNNVTVGLFETETKEYHSTDFIGDFEITSLLGSISTMNGEVYLHLHMNFADKSHNTFGGHLSRAVISATGEFLVEAISGNVDREFSDEIGLNLYKFK